MADRGVVCDENREELERDKPDDNKSGGQGRVNTRIDYILRMRLRKNKEVRQVTLSCPGR